MKKLLDVSTQEKRTQQERKMEQSLKPGEERIKNTSKEEKTIWADLPVK